jgi:hypothetical protein
MESTMYPLLKAYLESFDFTVKAEVNDVDIMAVKNDLIVLVEMKTSLNFSLMAQGIKRNKISDYVYCAIPKPTPKVYKSKAFKNKMLILKRLELGLLFVDIENKHIETILDPKTYTSRRKKKQRRALLKEFQARQTTYNIGGSTQTKIITAYRELALLALDFLRTEPQSTKALRTYTQNKKVVSILQKNYYGWFTRVSHGVYGITDQGKIALDTYHTVIQTLKNVNNNDPKSSN